MQGFFRFYFGKEKLQSKIVLLDVSIFILNLPDRNDEQEDSTVDI